VTPAPCKTNQAAVLCCVCLWVITSWITSIEAICSALAITILIYVGPAPCAEGPLAVIWPNALSTQRRHRAAIMLRGELWRVLPGVDLTAAGVMPGCCADPWSYYCLYDPMPHENCTAAASSLVLPHGAKEDRKVVVLSRPVGLMVQPSCAKKEFPRFQYYQPRPIAAGTRVDQLLVLMDSQGRTWRLVRVDSHIFQSITARGPEGPTHLLGWISLLPPNSSRFMR